MVLENLIQDKETKLSGSSLCFLGLSIKRETMKFIANRNILRVKPGGHDPQKRET